MQERFSIAWAVGITMAVIVGLAMYATLDLLLEPNAIETHARPPKGG